jgi:hypothetical protein
MTKSQTKEATMLALLKLIPGKVYLYAGIAIAVLTWYGIHNHDERAAGAAAALAPVKVLAQKAQIQVAKADAVAQTTETDNAKTYTAAVAAPAPRSLGIVCHRDTGSSELPEAVGVVATRIGNPATDSGSGPGYDPSSAALERAAQADAEIVYLQGRVHELEQQMLSSP